MPTEALRINIFLSSPGNLKADRDLVKRIVSEINIDTGSRLGFFINLITWETHTHPASGTHPQEVINKQIPEDIDIFLGLMGHYFGTPTKKWKSGTEEEFRIAHQNHKTHQQPEIMFYFSEFVKSTREIDSHQLRLVEGFREELSGLGFLYGSYNELSEFGYAVRRHLNAVIEKVIVENRKSNKKKPEEYHFAAEIASDYPSFDSLMLAEPKISAQVHLDKATEDIHRLASLMDKQKRSTVTFAKEITRVAQKIEAQKFKPDPKRLSECINIVTMASTNFDRALRQFIPNFRQTFEDLISNLQRYQIILNGSRMPEAAKLLQELSGHMRGFLIQISALKDATKKTVSAFDSWPESLENIRIRKKILQALLQDLDNLFKNSIALGEDFCKDIEPDSS